VLWIIEQGTYRSGCLRMSSADRSSSSCHPQANDEHRFGGVSGPGIGDAAQLRPSPISIDSSLSPNIFDGA
jgi:hypothetical protein